MSLLNTGIILIHYPEDLHQCVALQSSVRGKQHVWPPNSIIVASDRFLSTSRGARRMIQYPEWVKWPLEKRYVRYSQQDSSERSHCQARRIHHGVQADGQDGSSDVAHEYYPPDTSHHRDSIASSAVLRKCLLPLSIKPVLN